MSTERDGEGVIHAALARGESIFEVMRKTGASRTTVRRVRKKGVERKASDLRQPLTYARTPELVDQVRQKIEENPRQSINALTQEHGTSRRTMQKLVKEDLGKTSYAMRCGPRLTPATRQRRFDRASTLSGA